MFIILPFTGNSQVTIPRFQLEAHATLAEVHHHHCILDDKSLHKELNGGFGLRLNYRIKPNWILVGAFGFDHLIGQHKITPTSQFLALDIKYNLLLSAKHPYFFITAETGLKYQLQAQKFNLPIYIGFSYLMNGNMDLFVRFGVPKLYLIDDYESYKLMHNRIEIGLALNPKWNDLPKFHHYGGNPFILRSF